MFFSKDLISTASSIFLVFTLVSWSCFGQLLELDYSKQKQEESSFKVHLIRTGIVGMSSLKHLDFTIEALKLRFDAKKGSHFDFTLYGTQTIWNGSPENVLNTFDFLMNHIGGDINTNLFFSYPLSKKELQKKLDSGGIANAFLNNTSDLSDHKLLKNENAIINNVYVSVAALPIKTSSKLSIKVPSIDENGKKLRSEFN